MKAKTNVELTKTETIFNELERLHRQISQRAYDLFRHRGAMWGEALADWLRAENELTWKPAVEVRERNGQFEILAALPGVDAKDLDVQCTPEDVLIKAEIHHEHTAEKGTVHVCEFNRGTLFRSVHLPQRVDPDSVKADYRNGMLRLTAAIAKPAVAKNVEIKAA